MTKLMFGTGSRFARLSRSQAVSIVKTALHHQIYSFDTGFNYGNYRSSPLLSYALKRSCDDFDSIKISTKLGTYHKCLGTYKDFSVSTLTHSLNSTLSNFYPFKIDTLYLHGPSIADLQSTSLRSFLLKQKELGNVTRIGVNTHSLEVMTFLVTHNYPIDVVMIDLNLVQLNRLPLLLQFHANNIKVVIGTVFCQGLLHQSPLKLFAYNRSIFVLLRSLLKSSSRRFIIPAHRTRLYLSRNYPDTWHKLPLSIFTNMPLVESVSVGMLSPKSIVRNLTSESSIVDDHIISSILSDLDTPFYQLSL